MHWLVKLLFWPWFSAKYYEWQELLTNWQAVLIVACLFVMLFALQGPVKNPIGDRVKRVKGDWPSFLRHAITTMAATIEVGFVGYLSNLIVVASNGGKMPIAPHTLEEYACYWRKECVVNAYHVLATANTNFLFLADYIQVESSRLVTFLFGWADYVSPGDLTMAVSIIATWWIALVIFGWAIYYAIRRLFKV